jgi:hypothetical protein
MRVKRTHVAAFAAAVLVAAIAAVAVLVLTGGDDKSDEGLSIPDGITTLGCATNPWTSPDSAVGEVNEAAPQAAVVRSAKVSRVGADRINVDVEFSGALPPPPVMRDSSIGTFVTGVGLNLFLQLSENGPAASITQGADATEFFVADAITPGDNVKLRPSGTQVELRFNNALRITLDLEDFSTQGDPRFDPIVNVAVYEYDPPSRVPSAPGVKYYPEQTCQ